MFNAARPVVKATSRRTTSVVDAVMDAARRSGLLNDKTGRITGRVSPVLVEKAKARTGIDADTELVEFALANLALDDTFAAAFKASRGQVDPDLDLAFQVTAFDVDRALQWVRFDPGRAQRRRHDAELPFATEGGLVGPPLLLDTCVYIDQMQSRMPAFVGRLVEARQTNHSTVAIQELMHTIGVLNPKDRRSAKAIATIRDQIKGMPAHRVFSPDADILGRAALLAGILCRLQGYSGDTKLRALHDCMLFLQAQKLGCAVLTANLVEFDLLLQLQPVGRVLFYRTR